MNPSTTAKEWMHLLQENGYRVTGSRQVIVDILLASPCALEPVQIFETGRKQFPGLGLVTVYRTLEKLEELGLVQRVHQPGGCHMYLRATTGHEHLLICTRCGRVEYFKGDDLSHLMQSVSERSGYIVQDHWLQLFGLCKTCQSIS